MRRKVHTVGSAIVQKHGERYFICPEIISDSPIKAVESGLGFCSKTGSATF